MSRLRNYSLFMFEKILYLLQISKMSRNTFAQLPARFLITVLKTRFSSLAVNLPHKTRLLPRQVTQDMLQTAALNRDLLSKWDVDDTPWGKKKGRKETRYVTLHFLTFCCAWLSVELFNRCHNSKTFYTLPSLMGLHFCTFGA